MSPSFFREDQKSKFSCYFFCMYILNFQYQEISNFVKDDVIIFSRKLKFFNSYLFGIIKDVRLWDESKFFVLNMKKHEFSGSNLKIIGIISSLNFKGLIWSVYDGVFLSVLVCFRCMGGYLRWKPDLILNLTFKLTE